MCASVPGVHVALVDHRHIGDEGALLRHQVAPVLLVLRENVRNRVGGGAVELEVHGRDEVVAKVGECAAERRREAGKQRNQSDVNSKLLHERDGV